MEEARHMIGDTVTFTSDEYEALVDSQGLLLVTEWSDFRVPNWKVVKKLMEEHVVFDGRNIYEAAELNKMGFSYYGIGV